MRQFAGVFSLKSYKFDHVVHGAIASGATFGAMMGATAEQIESAIGMVVGQLHPVPGDPGGQAAAALEGGQRGDQHRGGDPEREAVDGGLLGPRDIFRNPEAIFRIFEGPGQMLQKVSAGGTPAAPNTQKKDASPFDLVLGARGERFRGDGGCTSS